MKHALLKKMGLKFHKEKQQKKTPIAPSALDVLEQLLFKEAVSPEAVKSAYNEAFSKLRENNDTTNSVAEQVTIPLKKEEESNAEPAASSDTPPNEEPPVFLYRTRHVALRFYYDGSNYSGLAENVGKADDYSVERALFAALQKTNLVKSRETSSYSRCGRTDKGVSSAGQVVALYLKSKIPKNATLDQHGTIPLQEEDLPKNASQTIQVWVPPKKDPSGPRVLKEISEYSYAKMLNNVLPVSIRILGTTPVSEEFSARFSCSSRTYRYFFLQRQLNIDKMSKALELLVGTHDFSNFCKMDVEKVYNFERKIHAARIVKDESSGVFYFEIVGQAFLWHQIRCIVSILFLVGRGLEEPSVVAELLNVEKYPGKPSYPLAPERPLVLHSCGYQNLLLAYSAPNLYNLTCRLEEEWEELVLAAARIRNCLESLGNEAVLARNDVVEFARGKLQERMKKQAKYKPAPGLSPVTQEALEKLDDSCLVCSEDERMTWAIALKWLAQYDVCPGPNRLKELAHIPLLQRSFAPTYQERLHSLSQSEKRRQKYEDNVIKKRKTTEEDQAFYKHKMEQGGSGI